jgi:hypothetical protein
MKTENDETFAHDNSIDFTSQIFFTLFKIIVVYFLNRLNIPKRLIKIQVLDLRLK